MGRGVVCLGWEQGGRVQEAGGAAAKPWEERRRGKEAVTQGCVWRSGWCFNIEKNRCADLVIGRSVVGSCGVSLDKMYEDGGEDGEYRQIVSCSLEEREGTAAPWRSTGGCFCVWLFLLFLKLTCGCL